MALAAAVGCGGGHGDEARMAGDGPTGAPPSDAMTDVPAMMPIEDHGPRRSMQTGTPPATTLDAGAPQPGAAPLPPGDEPTAVLEPAPELPSDVLDLGGWKITLPVDAHGNDSAGATGVEARNIDALEVYDLHGFAAPPHFELATDGSAVRFAAHAAGATTTGSNYPRSELRQRILQDGSSGGEGSAYDGYFELSEHWHLALRGRIVEVTLVEKPHVVLAQLHGDGPDEIMARYEGDSRAGTLFFEYLDGAQESAKLDYAIGEEYAIDVWVEAGRVRARARVAERQVEVAPFEPASSAGYFKAGCYLQSSVFLSDFKDRPDEAPGARAVVEIHALSVEGPAP